MPAEEVAKAVGRTQKAVGKPGSDDEGVADKDAGVSGHFTPEQLREAAKAAMERLHARLKWQQQQGGPQEGANGAAARAGPGAGSGPNTGVNGAAAAPRPISDVAMLLTALQVEAAQLLLLGGMQKQQGQGPPPQQQAPQRQRQQPKASSGVRAADVGLGLQAQVLPVVLGDRELAGAVRCGAVGAKEAAFPHVTAVGAGAAICWMWAAVSTWWMPPIHVDDSGCPGYTPWLPCLCCPVVIVDQDGCTHALRCRPAACCRDAQRSVCFGGHWGRTRGRPSRCHQGPSSPAGTNPRHTACRHSSSSSGVGR